MKQLIKSGIVENAVFALVVEVVGKEQKQNIKIKMSIVFPDLKEISKKFPGATYISYPTDTSAYAFLKIIPKMKSFGVFPPETLDDEMRKMVMLELESNGITITQQFQKNR